MAWVFVICAGIFEIVGVIGMNGVARAKTPVSYTHLDVYKRQSLSFDFPATEYAAAVLVFHIPFDKVQSLWFRLWP